MENMKMKPVWPKSKEEIWDEVFENISEQELPKTFLKRIPIWGYVAGLTVAVLLACYFYTVTEEAKRGEHSTVKLPDHSTVTLNAATKLSYKPLAWFFSRKVDLEGEAYFDVKPGSQFSVHSDRHTVKVVGTAFNVYARSGMYRVTCLSGEVKVNSGKKSVVLHSNMQVTTHDSTFRIDRDIVSSTVIGWMQGKFVFIAMPLQDVIAEIERQYNIHVTPASYPHHIYSGNFSKTEKPEEILEIIGKPFGITFRIE